MNVREARPDDFEGVTRLLAELGRPDVLGTADVSAHRKNFQTYLRRGDTVALVAEDEGIVGFCEIEFRQRLNFGAPEGWIPDMIVTEGARSRGAGAALLHAAEQAARHRGAWGIALESATWRTRAHAFYEREGFKEIGKVFSKVLDGSGWPPPPR